MVTVCPETEGFGTEVRAVAVAAWLTVCVYTGEVDPVKSASPLYTAVRLWDPILNDVVSDAIPPLSVPEPSKVAPSKKVMVPVGVPAPGETGVTVAVTVTGCP
jgi:hypothetical protein